MSKNLGGYNFYASKAAYRLAELAISDDVENIEKAIKLKQIADSIEKRKRRKMAIKQNIKNGLNYRFELLYDITPPPIICKE
ncbi:MAG: hypothetical protein ACOCRO_04415, partial [Halanaerobiales bacterium]